MKTVLFYVLIVLSLVILGAHFMRYENSIGVIGALVLIVLLIARQPWVARLLQVVLILGTLEWVRTLYELVQIRAAHGQPYGWTSTDPVVGSYLPSSYKYRT